MLCCLRRVPAILLQNTSLKKFGDGSKVARRWTSLRHLLCSHLPSVKSQRWSVLPNLNNGQHCFFWQVTCTELHPNENGCVLFFSGSFSYYNDMHVSCAFKREKIILYVYLTSLLQPNKTEFTIWTTAVRISEMVRLMKTVLIFLHFVLPPSKYLHYKT
jgi:hypothetical protein